MLYLVAQLRSGILLLAIEVGQLKYINMENVEMSV